MKMLLVVLFVVAVAAALWVVYNMWKNNRILEQKLKEQAPTTKRKR